MPVSLANSDERVCNRFHRIVPAINDELNVSFCKASNSLLSFSAMSSLPTDSSAHLKRREWCRCTRSSGSSILAPRLGLVILAGTHYGRLMSYLDAVAVDATVLNKDCLLCMKWRYQMIMQIRVLRDFTTYVELHEKA